MDMDKDSNTKKAFHFFLEMETMNWLFQQHKKSGEAEWKFGRNENISVDFISIAMHLAIRREEEGFAFRLYIRNQWGIYKEGDENLYAVFPEGKPGEIRHNSGRIGGNMSALIMNFMGGTSQLRKIIYDRSLEDELSVSDAEKEGVLVSQQGEDIDFKRVSGRERPSLAFDSIFTGQQMGRPYFDELGDNMARGQMSLSELEDLAEDGDKAAMEAVAKAYLEGNGTARNLEKSFKWWKKLAIAGDATGQFNTGLYLAKGMGTKRNFSMAADWMRRAAESGDRDAARAAEAYKKRLPHS